MKNDQVKYFSEIIVSKMIRTLEHETFNRQLRHELGFVLCLEILLRTGMRCDELAKIKIRDLKLERKSVIVTGSKGSSSRELPLPQGFLLKLNELIKEECMMPDDFLVGIVSPMYLKHKNPNSFKQRLRDFWRRNRLALVGPGHEDYGLHSLRHTFAVHLYRTSKDILLVQKALGHTELENTLKYAKLVSFIDRHNEILKAIG